MAATEMHEGRAAAYSAGPHMQSNVTLATGVVRPEHGTAAGGHLVFHWGQPDVGYSPQAE